MNAQSHRVLEAILSADETISLEQRDAAIAILSGRVPLRWPAFIKRSLKTPARPSPQLPKGDLTKTYYSRIQAAEYMGVSIRLFDQIKSRGDIPFTRLTDRRLLFAKDDLDALMKTRRIDFEE